MALVECVLLSLPECVLLLLGGRNGSGRGFTAMLSSLTRMCSLTSYQIVFSYEIEDGAEALLVACGIQCVANVLLMCC